MNAEEFSIWNRSMRKQVIAYLERHGIETPEVGEWPAFEIAPVFGIWCVESRRCPGKIGWWAFAGDCPTDYVAEDGQCHPRAALANLVKQWEACVPHMRSGKQPPGMSFGDASNLEELGNLLDKRIGILKGWIAQDDLWEER